MNIDIVQFSKRSIKRNRRLFELVKFGRWVFSLLRRPSIGLFTLVSVARLKKCGAFVELTPTMIIRNPHNIKIGYGCSFSNFVILDGHDQITIGNNCMFANKVTVATATHDYMVDPMNSSVITKPVKIDNNVWIGIGATILPGVTLGEGAVIGAMSLVINDIPARAIAVGVPAKVVKYRQQCANNEVSID